ncbi:unnamed protein product, partial [marine sediment metagenome]
PGAYYRTDKEGNLVLSAINRYSSSIILLLFSLCVSDGHYIF